VEATIRRPFHWGVAFVVAYEPDVDIPEPNPSQLVSANDHGICVLVRRAQDTDDVEGDYIKFAKVEVGLRVVDSTHGLSEDRREVFSGEINVPSGRLQIGDADEWTVVDAHSGANTIVVSVRAEVPADDLSPDAVWVELLPGRQRPLK
jgi:hypothetical protein